MTSMLFTLSAMSTAHARDLRVLTSLPDYFTKPFVEAFSQQYPAIKVTVLNKNTVASVEEILMDNPRGFDLFWSSSPEAFSLLEKDGRLRSRSDDGPDGASFADFAYSGVGWCWMEDFEARPPASWNDLLDPRFQDRLAMSHPARSGSTHMLLEVILQDRGWDRGWQYFFELSRNLKTITARSFSVIEGLKRGRFDVGLSIDFLALTEAPDGVRFRYGQPVMMAPARIAVLQNGVAPAEARLFVEFMLDKPAQKLLTRSDMRRIPVDETVREASLNQFPKEVRAALKFSWSTYDPDLAETRYQAVNDLFDIFITRNLVQRRNLLRRMDVLSAQVPPDLVPSLIKIKKTLNHLPVSEIEAARSERARGLRDTGLNTNPDTGEDWSLAPWRAAAKAQLAEVDMMLSELETSVRNGLSVND
jgi:ABC-type Fe3+ transport system substrate-binding protein